MLVLPRLNKKDGTLLDREKRKIDDLFRQYDPKIRDWILEKLRDDLILYNYLISPITDDERHPASIEKHLAESISNIRRFVRALWPRKGKKGRMIETYMDWLNPEDEGEMLRDSVRFKKEEL